MNSWRTCLLLAALAACSTLSAATRLRLNELAAASAVIAGTQSTENDRPLIGILSQPGSPAPKGSSYIAASYVKFVESAGARVVPIKYDAPREEIEARVGKVNGLLLPGGSAPITPGHLFYDTVSFLVNLTIAANDAGEYFPLHGTCLGLEALAIVIASGSRVLEHYNSDDFPSALLLTPDAKGSRFFDGMPPGVVASLQASPIAMENHQQGLSAAAVDKHPKLKDFFKVTSLATDRDGGVYVSSMEARDYPITATQWHPEKNAFEFAAHLHIPHSPAAVEVTHAVAMFFVGEARKNGRAPANQAELDDLMIYNWPPTFTGRHSW
ncbi:hypothetical protein WJX81_001350 [Elliptochloris bilobata]|uniref:folate gamma-glutamyl hydrolase n=1 Tax=Elliptochloris bilobata TaxID=381761 RepID=A0AAW1RA41_9CHLO